MTQAVLVETVANQWAAGGAMPGSPTGTQHVISRTPSAYMPFDQAMAAPCIIQPVSAFPSCQAMHAAQSARPCATPSRTAVAFSPNFAAGAPPYAVQVVRCESQPHQCCTPPPPSATIAQAGAGLFSPSQTAAAVASAIASTPPSQKSESQTQPLLSELRKQVDDLRCDLTGIRAELEEELRRRQAAEAAKLAADAQARGLRDTMTQLCEELVVREREAERLRTELQEAQLGRHPGLSKIGDTGSDCVSLNSSAPGRATGVPTRSLPGGGGGRDRKSISRPTSRSSQRGNSESRDAKDTVASRASLASSRASSLSRQSTTMDNRASSLDNWESRKASVVSEALNQRQRERSPKVGEASWQTSSSPAFSSSPRSQRSLQQVKSTQSQEMSRTSSSKAAMAGQPSRQGLSGDRTPSQSRATGTAPVSPWSTLRSTNASNESSGQRNFRADATGGTPSAWTGQRRGSGSPSSTGKNMEPVMSSREGQWWQRSSRRNSESGDWSPLRPSASRNSRASGKIGF